MCNEKRNSKLMNRIFDRFENMLDFVLEDTKWAAKSNIRSTHLLCAAPPMNRKLRVVTVNFRQNSVCSSPTLGNGDTK